MKHQISTLDLTALFDSLSAGFIYFTPDGTIGYCNDTAACLFDTTPSGMTGLQLTDLPVQFLSDLGLVLPPDKNPLSLAFVQRTMQLDKLFHIKTNKKKEAWIRCNIEPICDVVKDSFEGAVLSFIEVTDAIIAKREQKENEEKYRHHFMFSEGATFLATKDGTYLGVSTGAEKMFGYTSAELKAIGREGLLIHDENFINTLAERDKKGKAVAEVKARCKDGAILPVLYYASLFTTSTGDELVSVAMIDLSEKKELEYSAKKLDYNLQLILDNTDETFILLDESFTVLSFNKAAVKIFKQIHNKQLRPGANINELFNTIHKKELEQILQTVLEGASRELQRVYNFPQGKLKVFQSTFRPLYKREKVIGVIINSRDITQKYKIQQELLQSHERYKRAALASYDILWEHDLVEHTIYFSESFTQAFGYQSAVTSIHADEFAGKFLHPDDKAPTLEAVRSFLKSNEIHFTYPVHRLLKQDGSFIYAEAQVIASRDEEGEAYLLTGVTRDITERYLMERQLIESNERYNLVLKATSDVVWDLNLETNTNWFSDNLTLKYGHERMGTTLKDWEEKVHPDDRAYVLESIAKAIEDGKTHWQAEYRFLNANGGYEMVYDRGYTLYDAKKKPYRMIGAMQNITEVKNLQQKIIDEQINGQRKITEATIKSQEKEREELGNELHDNINQILATCKMLIDVSIKNEDLRNDFLPKSYEYLNKAIEEIRVLSKSLVPPTLGDIGLSEAVDDLINTQSGCGCGTTSFVLTGDKIDAAAVSNDRQLMAYRIVQEQLNNIAKYAKASEVEVHLSLTNKNLLMKIKDNGVGFNPAEKKKGIGLRNMKSRVKAYGGEVTINSSNGNGCLLEVNIPVD